ncbi:MAG: glycosyltransferase family 2 protein [candidate division KSB1 bacterium]|nr:glycosyltransferase family 2 protein [candidate division KSB1 bacterium]
MENPDITVVIPAFNEQESIRNTIEKLQIMMDSDPRVWECIVVDDGSLDDTAKIASSCRVKLIRHSRQKGYGAALKTAILASSSEIICITDADETYPNDKLPVMVNELADGVYDMVVGDRQGKYIKSQKARGLTKWTLKKIANWLVSEKIPDLNSGLRVFRRQALVGFLSILPDGFSFTTTITLAMLTNDYSVRYYPIDYFERKGRSKIRPVHDTLGFVNLILKIGLYFKPLKIFFSLSLVLVLVAVFWALFSVFVMGQFADASTMAILMAAFQIGALGLLAELINTRIHASFRKKSETIENK